MFKQDLLDFSFSELEIFCKDKNLPKFRASQIWRWMYCFGLKSFLEMNNISKSTRELLNEFSLISRPQISEKQISKDGTIKWLI
ncbi:MAG: 23S rRNA (adenine(2503)-C(2))-methyltransferase RlmN, partial [Rhodospirillaceae bacterium]|nr:23S rRNA (adenine(2503)-C(2))-methyltransferase RlmN [Rhodospirillaceae bacterium]